MTINKIIEGTRMVVSPEGRLDTNSAPELEKEINASLTEIKELVLDFEKLNYVSSAGLRVILSAQKKMNQQGAMVVKNVNEDIKELFYITGFVDILIIE